MKTREMLVHPGDEIEITIDTVNHQGQGVGRYQGIAVFVPMTVPGERILAKVKEVKKNYAVGKIERILFGSQGRVTPRCSSFTSCGGSQFQHMDYDLQLELKQKMVLDALTRIGKVDNPVVRPVLGMTDPWGYRNKVQFQVECYEGRVRLGFFEEGTHSHIPATGCLLVDDKIRNIAAMVENLLNDHHVAAYDWTIGKGVLRHVVIRRGLHTSQIMIVFVTSTERTPALLSVAKEIRAKVPAVVSVVRNINSTGTRQIFGRESELLSGQRAITEQLADLTFTISPTSFFQVNSRQTEVLYEKALEYTGLTGTETVLDVYCGIGTISLFLARKAARVFGFEVSGEAVQDAAANAVANKINNVEFIAGKAEERLPGLVSQGIRPEVVVVDPPRQGIEKRALQAIADMEPQRIVYISCDPATMARDVNLLHHRGYELKEVQPVDMFPQTSHVECVIMMTNSGSKGK